jgi:FkbM family methyltransferase
MLWVQLLSVLIRKKLFGKNHRRLLLPFNGTIYTWHVRDAADVAMLEEVFGEQEYALPLPSWEPRTIVDVGAHIGSATLYFAIRYPNAHIISYETDPDTFALLKKNTAPFSRITCVQAAVSEAEGKVPFYVSQSSIGSSLLKREGAREITVDGIPFKNVLEERPDLIKFDVEGAEYALFSSVLPITSVPVLIGEVHYDLMQKSKDDLLSCFSNYTHTERQTTPFRSILTLIHNQCVPRIS